MFVHSSVIVAYSESRHISGDPTGFVMGFFSAVETVGCIWLNISHVIN